MCMYLDLLRKMHILKGLLLIGQGPTNTINVGYIIWRMTFQLIRNFTNKLLTSFSKPFERNELSFPVSIQYVMS